MWIGFYGLLMLFLAAVSSLTVFEVVNLGAITLEFYLDPIGTLYWCKETRKILCLCPDLNQGPLDWWANALPLYYLIKYNKDAL